MKRLDTKGSRGWANLLSILQRPTMTTNNEVNATPVIPPTMFSEQANAKRPKQNVVNLLSYDEVVKVVAKVLKRNPESSRKYVHGEKRVLTLRYLAVMVLNACDYKADPHMVDKVLLEKLQNVKAVQTKVSLQQNGIPNRGSCSVNSWDYEVLCHQILSIC